MKTISDLSCHNSLFGHIYEDIWYYLRGMQHASVSCIERRGGGGGGDMMAHSLARYARNLSNEMYWIEDSPPPPAVEALYQDSLHIIE